MFNVLLQVPEEWSDMTVADWMDMTPADWVDRMQADWTSRYNEMMNARPSDWLGMMYGRGMGPAMGEAEAPAREGGRRRRHGRHARHEYEGREKRWREHRQHRKHHHHHDCGCSRCESDFCECYCCIGDVDLAVYTRVGEQRVIELVIENERHREKEITLEFSDWTTRGGSKAPVETVLLEPKTFTIPACGEQRVTLVVRVGAVDRGDMTDAEKEKAAEEEAGAANRIGATSDFVANVPQRTQLPDVDDCLVATADLRIVGCDQRPLRLAVAILPRDCDPYRVHCGCTCC